MNKQILKCIVLFTLILSTVVGVLSFTSCNRSIDEEEVLTNAKELLQRAEVLNQVYYGKGIEYNKVSNLQNGAYYDADPTHLSKLGFSTIEELKVLTERTFTVEYSIQLYSTILSPLTVDDVTVALARYYQKYEGDNIYGKPVCIMVYSQFNVLFYDTITYDYSTLRVKGVKGEVVTIAVDATTMNSEGKSQDVVIDIQLIEENDGWRINNHTWANYNPYADRLEELEKEELK